MASWQKGDECFWKGWENTSSLGEMYVYGAQGRIVAVDSDDMVKIQFQSEERPVFRPTRFLARDKPPQWDAADWGLGPGKFTVVASKGMPFLAKPDMATAKPGKVEHHDEIEIVEVAVSEAEKIIYGKLKDPDAWIVILAGAVPWAEKAT